MELSHQFLSAVEEQYACLYLNSLGASNSEANMCVCMLHARSPRVRCAAWVCVACMVPTKLWALCTHTLFGFVPALASLAYPVPSGFFLLRFASMMPDFVKLCFFGPCLLSMTHSRQVLQSMPIKDAKVAASWRVRGAPVNALHIMPHYRGGAAGKPGMCMCTGCVCVWVSVCPCVCACGVLMLTTVTPPHCP